MALFRFHSVAIEAWAFQATGSVVSSAEIEDKLAPVFEHLRIPSGTLERLSGVNTRRWWPISQAPSVGAAAAAKEALDNSGVPLEKIGMLISCSVCRDHFEPATACHVHRSLGLPSTTVAFDVTNACLGFSNGLILASQLVESGALEAVLVVTGENPGLVIDNTTKLLLDNPGRFTRDEFISFLPTFTLGCGAAAFLVCHEKLLRERRPRIRGSVAFTQSEHDQLCRGNVDFAVLEDNPIPPIMHTQASTLISAAVNLARTSWQELSRLLEWTADEMAAFFPHQIGKQVNNSFFEFMGVATDKDVKVYPEYGNMVSAALPAAVVLGAKTLSLPPGSKACTLGFGSGLNSIFLGIEF